MLLKRTALHALVWSKPMTHLAKELGISDVGLAKACRRHGVPVPPRGYWAQLAAGKALPKTLLPEVANDYEVQLATIGPERRNEERQERTAFAAAVSAKQQALIAMQSKGPKRPLRAHPLVVSTRAYAAKIPQLIKKRLQARERGEWHFIAPCPPDQDRGRWYVSAPDGLHFVVAQENLEWTIDLHENLIRGLESAGVRCSGGRHPGNRELQLVCELHGEELHVGFSEGYRRRSAIASGRGPESDSPGRTTDQAWEASGRFTWSMCGTEHSVAQKWSGTQTETDAKLPEVIAGCLTLLEAQPEVRAHRLANEERARQESSERERKRRRKEALGKQVEYAFSASRAYADEIALLEYLTILEMTLSDYREPFREKLSVWITAVRDELKRFPPHLQVLADSILGNRWNDDPPEWWPEDITWPRDNKPVS